MREEGSRLILTHADVCHVFEVKTLGDPVFAWGILLLGRMLPDKQARIIIAHDTECVDELMRYWQEHGVVMPNFVRKHVSTPYHKNLFAWVDSNLHK